MNRIRRRLLEVGSKTLGYLRRQLQNERAIGCILYPRDIDVWNRYAGIAKEIKKTSIQSMNLPSILEVGSGPGTVLEFLKPPKYRVTLVDVRRSVFAGKKHVAEVVVADGCKLPFKEGAFDAVLSIDTVKHVPREIRHLFFEELKRTCRERLFLHFPLESSNDQFRGKEYDIRFQRIHRKAFGMDNPRTTDHIRCGHPTFEDIQREFPTSKILGRENCDIWLRYMILARRALIGFFTGIIYFIFWKRRDNKPPYHGCLVTVDIAKT